ncbi:MAG: hypothetical protein JSW53_00310 [Candidatus Bathyarchaeota archaeon]|nr:MAG: hypothetical protein JSW53_00310 [Candidatus Bathyarchaeota archaeon]
MIGVSYFSLFIAVMLTFNPPLRQEGHLWRKPMIGAIFGLICLLGVAAVFFPKKSSAMLRLASGDGGRDLSIGDRNSHGDYPALQGHHPDCIGFSAHVIQIGDKILCAACTGLLLGAIMTLAGTVLYFYGDLNIAQNSSLAVFVGTVGVGLGLFQLKFRSFLRLLLNILFVLSSFSILIGIDALTQSLSIDLFLVVMIIFWLFTRILLSEWDHWNICYTCRSPCEIREKRIGQYLRLNP